MKYEEYFAQLPTILQKVHREADRLMETGMSYDKALKEALAQYPGAIGYGSKQLDDCLALYESNGESGEVLIDRLTGKDTDNDLGNDTENDKEWDSAINTVRPFWLQERWDAEAEKHFRKVMCAMNRGNEK